jgi:predicted ABC-class ATPase
MRNHKELESILRRIDNRGYKAYHDIKGEYGFPRFQLFVDHVQGDPFAKPSKIRVRISHDVAAFPADAYRGGSRNTAFADFAARNFYDACRRFARPDKGTGHSGMITIEKPGQEILKRSSVVVNNQNIEVRFFMGLPAFGRRIAGHQAIKMFLDELPRIVDGSLLYKNIDSRKLYRHVEVNEDADFLRNQLEKLGIVSFVADDSVLPRASGIDDRPKKEGDVVSFKSPGAFSLEVDLPNSGRIRGMGIPKGITLIAGGGYHGKSTLLNAIALGVYNHIPGDGREFAVTEESAVKIRAEDGRNVANVNISAFIDNLPFGRDTKQFSTENASGSTSQAANIIEALEIDGKVLLIDEDTSATNFMIRDHRMQELVAKEHEPITPFIDKAEQLYGELGVSTILVIGGSGDYFSIADHIICMSDYLPYDYTEKAKNIAEKYKSERAREGGTSFGDIDQRIPLADSIDPSRGRREVKVAAKGLHHISFGRADIDLSAVEQLMDMTQTKAIADAIVYAKRFMDGGRTLREVISMLYEELDKSGFDILSRLPSGEYSFARKIEFACALNRLRTIELLN